MDMESVQTLLANVPETIVLSFSALCLLLVAGKVLRVKVKLFQRLYLPSSVIGGILGLVIIQTLGGYLPEGVSAGWSRLPGFLTSIVFATLFLGVTILPLKTIWQKSGPQLAYGQIVAWGQYGTALGIAMLLLVPVFKVQGYIGTIVPVGFEGGHGTAAGLKNTFEYFGWAEGTDYALASATAGIVFAITIGMVLINWAARTGVSQKLKRIEDMPESSIIGVYEVDERPIAGRQTVSSASIDSLAFHLSIVGVAVFIGYLLKTGLIAVESIVRSAVAGGSVEETGKVFFEGFPLFPLAMIGGLIIQMFVSRYPKINPVDHQLMQRLSGTAMDFLVVAAISTIRLRVIMEGLVPFAILVATGVAWNVFCVTWLARRFLQKPDWFERAIAEMGQSMGVTATGLLLLRVVDPESETDALSAFGYKQLLHEPFMGGGLWTSMAVPLAITQGPMVVCLISIVAIAAWVVVWALLFRNKAPAG